MILSRERERERERERDVVIEGGFISSPLPLLRCGGPTVPADPPTTPPPRGGERKGWSRPKPPPFFGCVGSVFPCGPSLAPRRSVPRGVRTDDHQPRGRREEEAAPGRPRRYGMCRRYLVLFGGWLPRFFVSSPPPADWEAVISVLVGGLFSESVRVMETVAQIEVGRRVLSLRTAK